jgi:hypothetical protein
MSVSADGTGGYRLGTARGRINVSYKGFVVRQELVDWCQAQLPRIQHHVETLEKARDLTSDSEQIQNFNEAISRLFGEQTALRNVCEWAKQRVEDGQEGFKNQIDGTND